MEYSWFTASLEIRSTLMAERIRWFSQKWLYTVHSFHVQNHFQNNGKWGYEIHFTLCIANRGYYKFCEWSWGCVHVLFIISAVNFTVACETFALVSVIILIAVETLMENGIKSLNYWLRVLFSPSVAYWLRSNMPKLYVWQVVHLNGNDAHAFIFFSLSPNTRERAYYPWMKPLKYLYQ